MSHIRNRQRKLCTAFCDKESFNKYLHVLIYLLRTTLEMWVSDFGMMQPGDGWKISCTWSRRFHWANGADWDAKDLIKIPWKTVRMICKMYDLQYFQHFITLFQDSCVRQRWNQRIWQAPDIATEYRVSLLWDG